MFLSFSSYSQNNEKAPVKKKIAISFGEGVGFWQQSNLNKVLMQNGIPETKDLQFMAMVGASFQWNE
jgi:hypothetical protein